MRRQQTFVRSHSIVVGASRRGPKDRATFGRKTLGYRPNPHSTRRAEANSNRLRELHRSRLTPGSITTALLLNITGDTPYAVLHLAHEHNIRG